MKTMNKCKLSEKSVPVKNSRAPLTELWLEAWVDVSRFGGVSAIFINCSWARLGIDVGEVDAYARGDRRISVGLRLEIAKSLSARQSLLFHGQEV